MALDSGLEDTGGSPLGRGRAIEMFMHMGELHDSAMSIYAEGGVQMLTESTGVADGMCDYSTELGLEAAKTAWLGALACWVVSQHMHWRLLPRGLSHPYSTGAST